MTNTILGIETSCDETAAAVVTGGAIAMVSGPAGPGSGGLILWPIFGVTNQLLAGLAFLVICFYLIRHNRPVWFLIGPTALMIVVPAWALLMQLFGEAGWVYSSDPTKRYLLTILGLGTLLLQAWMVIEALFMWRHAKGVAPEPLPGPGSSHRGVAC